MIRLQDVMVTLGGEEILSGATVHVRPEEKVGVVGRNGSGKSTLLRLMEGALTPDTGTIERRSRITIGTLSQHAVANAPRSIWDEARSGMARILALQERVAKAESELQNGTPEAAARFEQAMEELRLAGGLKADEQVGRVLRGLGFLPDDWARPCKELSGGWQMRVALARLLLSSPDVALLDEPTNHLDLLARSWLAGFLREVPYAVVVVSHDRHLLEVSIDRILEVRGGKVISYPGRYRDFLMRRAERLAQQQAQADSIAGERARLQGFVDRFGAKATKAAQARSRKKMLERLDDVEVETLDARPHLRFPDPPAGHSEVITLRGVSVGWEEPLIEGLDLALHRGQRLALVGPNGCGKSTLLSAITGQKRPLAGRVHHGVGFRLGQFRQDMVSHMPLSVGALDWAMGQAPEVPPERLRGVLGALGLRGDEVFRKLSELSGGERARVALSVLAVRPASLLVLDEPTNHLDLETIEVLSEALASWEGALVLVTHDRWVVERVATHVGRFGPDGLDVHPGVRPEDFDVEPRKPETAAAGPSEQALDYAERKQKKRETARLERQIERLAQEIEQAESQLAELDAALVATAADYEAAQRLGEEREALGTRIAGLYEEWEGCEAELSEL